MIFENWLLQEKKSHIQKNILHTFYILELSGLWHFMLHLPCYNWSTNTSNSDGEMDKRKLLRKQMKSPHLGDAVKRGGSCRLQKAPPWTPLFQGSIAPHATRSRPHTSSLMSHNTPNGQWAAPMLATESAVIHWIFRPTVAVLLQVKGDTRITYLLFSNFESSHGRWVRDTTMIITRFQ